MKSINVPSFFRQVGACLIRHTKFILTLALQRRFSTRTLAFHSMRRATRPSNRQDQLGRVFTNILHLTAEEDVGAQEKEKKTQLSQNSNYRLSGASARTS